MQSDRLLECPVWYVFRSIGIVQIHPAPIGWIPATSNRFCLEWTRSCARHHQLWSTAISSGYFNTSMREGLIHLAVVTIRKENSPLWLVDCIVFVVSYNVLNTISNVTTIFKWSDLLDSRGRRRSWISDMSLCELLGRGLLLKFGL